MTLEYVTINTFCGNTISGLKVSKSSEIPKCAVSSNYYYDDTFTYEIHMYLTNSRRYLKFKKI